MEGDKSNSSQLEIFDRAKENLVKIRKDLDELDEYDYKVVKYKPDLSQLQNEYLYDHK